MAQPEETEGDHEHYGSINIADREQLPRYSGRFGKPCPRAFGLTENVRK